MPLNLKIRKKFSVQTKILKLIHVHVNMEFEILAPYRGNLWVTTPQESLLHICTVQ